MGVARRKAKDVSKEDQKATFFHSLNKPLVIQDDGEALGEKTVNYIVDASQRYDLGKLGGRQKILYSHTRKKYDVC